MYQVQQTDDGYQIFLQTTVQEYPLQIVGSPLENEQVYTSKEDALKRLQALNQRVRQKLGRVVEITIQCNHAEREPVIRSVCVNALEPLQETLEFLAFTDQRAVETSGEPQPGMVHFLMRLLEPLTHADADGPLRNLLSQVIVLDGVTKASFSFQVLEFVE